ncbi:MULTISPECIES: hypothetical protein [unclassified Acinetobacter]|uniref:hypothetical protein n=1 Tax=unclassified Acinetobacter TaxID=196816 RepID=UPI00211EC11C|nr:MULTISPECIES: hypothetical protein [unclassified Acinetobacter]UUS58886.1 hypothetical protein MST16_06960 [Acinetobacter sp. YH16040_T]
MAAQILLKHAAKEKYIHHIHEKFRDCFQMQDDITAEKKPKLIANIIKPSIEGFI